MWYEEKTAINEKEKKEGKLFQIIRKCMNYRKLKKEIDVCWENPILLNLMEGHADRQMDIYDYGVNFLLKNGSVELFF